MMNAIRMLQNPVDGNQKLVEKIRADLRLNGRHVSTKNLLCQHIPNRFQSFGLTGIKRKAFLNQSCSLELLGLVH